MIVANMNLHEDYADLMGEMNKLDWKRDALLNKAVGVLKRSMEFPASVTYDYQMQSSKNQYIIYFYREHPFAPVLSGYLCVMFDGNKRYVIKWTDKGIPEILILTSHFLQRYKERFLKQPDLSANEVAVRFLSRNRTLRIMPIDVDPDLNISKIQLMDAILKELSSEGFSESEASDFWSDFDNLQKAKIVR